MGNKRITCFIGALSSGGAEHQLCELSKLLADSGYEVELVTFSDADDHYHLDERVKRVRIAPRQSGVKKLLAIFWYFFRCKSDCIISYGQRASVYCLFPLQLRRRGIKVLACERSCTLNRKPDRYEKALMGGLYKRADWIICNSYSQANHIIKKRPKLEKKVKTIINYIDLAEYASNPMPNNEKTRIGVFARYIRLKNYERLVEVAKRLKKAGYGFTIEWYGNMRGKNGIENPEYAELKELVKKNDISDVFILNDHVPSTASVIPQYDAVCLASLWEGFSNTIAEAISCGRPMLASDVSDNGVMVKDGVNGFLFDPFDTKQIYKTFETFIRMTPALKEKMGKRSREMAETLFDKKVFVESYIKYIEN